MKIELMICVSWHKHISFDNTDYHAKPITARQNTFRSRLIWAYQYDKSSRYAKFKGISTERRFIKFQWQSRGIVFFNHGSFCVAFTVGDFYAPPTCQSNHGERETASIMLRQLRQDNTCPKKDRDTCEASAGNTWSRNWYQICSK